MKKVTKGRIVKFMSLALAVAVVAGSVITFKVRSQADEITDNNSTVTQNNEEAENSYKEFEEEVNRIKSKYNVEETITTLNDLHKALLSEQNLTEEKKERIIAAASNEVILQFVVDEFNKGIKEANKSVEEINNVLNSKEEIPSNVEVEAYTNGDYVAKKTSTNEYGTTDVTEISDRSADVSRGWSDLGVVTSKPANVAYGDRYYTYYKFMKAVGKIGNTIRFRAHYTVSKNGLKAVKIVDDGTKTNSPLAKLYITDKQWDDKVATKANTNIDGTVYVRSSIMEGFSFNGVTAPAVGSYNIKINFWITIKRMNAGNLTLTHSMHSYTDDIAWLS